MRKAARRGGEKCISLENYIYLPTAYTTIKLS